MNAQSQAELLAEELGAVAGRIEREVRLRVDAALADIARERAEERLRIAGLEQVLRDRIATLKDGAPGRDGVDGKDGAPGRDGERGADGAPGRDGKDGASGRDGVDGSPGERGADGEPGRDGVNGKDGAPGRDGIDGKDGAAGERGADGVAGRDGADGKLPIVKEWSDEVHYKGDCVTLDGSTYQALRDTGKPVTHDDWRCIARAGAQGLSVSIEGTFDPARGDYRALSIVALNGGSFVAKHDNPGLCPGDGWQLLASRGKPGKEGERGPAGGKGDRGPAGPAVEMLDVSPEGLLELKNADGSTVELDLYPLLAKVQQR